MSKSTQQKKGNPKEDKDEAPTKTAKVVKAEKKETVKPQPKADTKTEAKADTKTGTKAPPRRNLNEAIAFIYGGHFKANRVFVFAVPSKDVKAHYLSSYSEYYGKNVSCRYVKCETSDEVFKKVIEQASKDGVQPEDGVNILALSVSNASKLLRDISGSDKAHTQKISEVAKSTATKKSPTKGEKKASAAEDNDGDEEDGDGDGDGDGEDEDAENNEDEDNEDDGEEEQEEEEEEKPQPKKTPAKKQPAKGGKKA